MKESGQWIVPENADETHGNNEPKELTAASTGDDNPLEFLAVMFVISIFAMAAGLYYRKNAGVII